MYSHIIACTGWTWEYIDDHMTIPRLKDMNEYWADNPPVHLMVAKYLGFSKKQEVPAEVDEGGNSLFDLLPHG